MNEKSAIKRTQRKVSRKLIEMGYQLRNHNKKVSIISQNCLGGDYLS